MRRAPLDPVPSRLIGHGSLRGFAACRDGAMPTGTRETPLNGNRRLR
jgi:hypothetical protein